MIFTSAHNHIVQVNSERSQMPLLRCSSDLGSPAWHTGTGRYLYINIQLHVYSFVNIGPAMAVQVE